LGLVSNRFANFDYVFGILSSIIVADLGMGMM